MSTKARCLILNQDFTPLDIIHFHKGIVLVYLDRVRVIEYFDWFIRGASGAEYPVPAVIQTKKYIKKTKALSLTRLNLLARDSYKCCYCQRVLTLSTMTVDHVVPRCKFANPKAATYWGNVVSACKPCNSFKGDQPLNLSGLTLSTKPFAPTYQSVFLKKEDCPQEWFPYLNFRK